MDRDTAAQVVRFAEGLGLDLSWCAYTARDWLVKEKADPRVIREENIVRAQSRAGRVEELAPDEAVYKVMCICAPECTDAAEAALRAAFPQCSVVRSSPILIEVTRRGVNKGQAVRRLCEALGVAPEDAAAFGDNFNDVQMLEAVGMPYLMGNAPEALKECFRNHAPDNDHDGIAWALEEMGV